MPTSANRASCLRQQVLMQRSLGLAAALSDGDRSDVREYAEYAMRLLDAGEADAAHGVLLALRSLVAEIRRR